MKTNHNVQSQKNRSIVKWFWGVLLAHTVTTFIAILMTFWLGVALIVYRFEMGDPQSNIKSYGDAIWWGLVTLLTVGYGDRYPVTLGGRVFAGALMTMGVISIGFLTAKISSYLLERALREGRGQVNTSSLVDHFIICGWKEDMHELLSHILDFNPDLSASDLVMVANIGAEAITAIKSQPRFKAMHIIAGDYISEVILRKAHPEKARKVLLLADRTRGSSGSLPSLTEVDARTIMTAMSLSHIAKGTLVAAEILDSKMDEYLKLAGVSEIIYIREYSRLLLGNASAGTGVSNIIFDLLAPSTGTFLATRAIEDKYFGAQYKTFKSEFEKNSPQSVVIGILENAGSRQNIKELAVRKAQKTADVGKLLANLKGVKGLLCNHPVFNPPETFVLEEGSMVIVIENRPRSEAASLGGLTSVGSKTTTEIAA